VGLPTISEGRTTRDPVAPAGRSMSKLPSVAVAVCRRMSEFVHSTMSFTFSPSGAGPKASLWIPILCTCGLAPHELFHVFSRLSVMYITISLAFYAYVLGR
jgi:hypothetical protein